MKCYIWRRVTGLTDRHHDAGGLVIVAPSLERARELLRATEGVRTEVDEYGETPCEAFDRDPDQVYDLAGTPEERVWVFPNAGCC